MARRLGAHSLARLAEEALERHGDYPSVWFEGRWHGAAELLERSRRLAGGLTELGVSPGDRVLVMMANAPEVRVAYTAAWRAGAAVTPVIFMVSPEELRRIVADSEPSVVVTSSEFVETVKSAVEGATSVKALVSSGPEEEGVVALASLEAASSREMTPCADSDLAVLMYTGGTTGRAKGVMLSHENFWLAGKAGHDAAYVPGVTRGLVTLPLSHSYGLLVTVASLHAREPPTTVLMRWFDPASFLELIQEHRVQTTAVVPSMLQLLLSQPLEDYDLATLRYVVCGAAPLAPEIAEGFASRVPHAELREGYGLTETAALVSTNPPGRVRRGSVGLPVPGVEVRVVDDRDSELPAGEVGEICCRSKFVMLGYWRAPELTREALRGGWLHTGDMGYLDDDGYLFIVDRRKDLIIRAGFNVFPRDVEDALLEHPAVAAAGVVGRPDELHGEEVVAFVSLRGENGATPEELIAFARDRIGGYKYPREVRVVSSIPLTPVGKVDRNALRALL